MTDRELLEKAAKAAGMWATDFEIEDDSDQPVFDEARGFRLAWGRGWWNPRHDDADVLRLASKLNMQIHFGKREALWSEGGRWLSVKWEDDCKLGITTLAAAIHDAKGQR